MFSYKYNPADTFPTAFRFYHCKSGTGDTQLVIALWPYVDLTEDCGVKCPESISYQYYVIENSHLIFDDVQDIALMSDVYCLYCRSLVLTVEQIKNFTNILKLGGPTALDNFLKDDPSSKIPSFKKGFIPNTKNPFTAF